jgi:predicted O-methyltransferase YrrM
MTDPIRNGLGRQVDDYIQGLFVPSDPVLEEALMELERAGLPPINVSPNEGKLLNILAMLSGAKKMVEIGTLAGYSAIWLARALPEGGKLITLELDTKHAEVARKNLERAGLSSKVEIRVGPALASLEKMQAEGEGPFDLFFIDADKDAYPAYLEMALKLAQPGTVILADNVIGRILDPNANVKMAQGVRQFNQNLADNPGLNSIILPIIRERLDGLSISIVR